MSHLWRAMALAVALSVAACAIPTKRTTNVEGRPTPDLFDVSARIAVQNGKDGYTGSMRWQRRDQRDAVDIFTPVGTLFAKITRTPTGAVIETTNGKRYENPNPEELAREVIGWDLPLESLRYWLFARPAPQTKPQRFDYASDGKPSLLEQDGWRVTYLGYTDTGADVLPSRLELDHPGLKVKMIVARWRDVGGATP